MKKWSAAEMIVNCDDDTSFKNGVKFTYTPIDDEGQAQTPVVFFTWENFYDIMLERYTSFNYLTGSYHSSVSNTEVEICDTFAKALAKFKKSVNTFVADKQNAFEKLYYALYANYNPISNYDKHSHITVDYKGKETNTNTPTGTETDTFTKSGTETVTETPSGSETTTLTKSGKEVNKNTPVGSETKTTTKTGTETDTEVPTGSETVTHNLGQNTSTTSRTTYDNATFNDAEKVVDASKINTDVTTYSDRQTQNTKTFTNRQDAETTTFASRETTDELSFTNRQDSEVKTFTNRETETETSFTNRQDTNVKSFTNRVTTDEKTFTNRQDETNEYTYGNIGVTTTQQMITSQFPLTELDEIKQYIVNSFVHKYLIV